MKKNRNNSHAIMMNNYWTSLKQNNFTSNFNLKKNEELEQFQLNSSYDNRERENKISNFPGQEDKFGNVNKNSESNLKSNDLENIQDLKINRMNQKLEKDLIMEPEEKINRSLSVS